MLFYFYFNYYTVLFLAISTRKPKVPGSLAMCRGEKMERGKAGSIGRKKLKIAFLFSQLS